LSSTTADPKTALRRERLAAAPAAVTVDHVHKTFRLPHQQFHTLKERVLHPMRSMTYDELRALQDVHVSIAQGEFFGIVGRNGSGKSTLLKCLAGIYRPDAGAVQVSGRLSPFIELGVGFNPDLTARDNVVINAVMMGLTRREARRAFDEVIAFAELEEFIDLKLKNYSSGMAVRLGFATAIQVDADVLLVDEVLAVGDAAFQQKCFDEFSRLRAAGKTIVFVTHDMAATERFCDRAMLLDRGNVVEIGDPREIAHAYNELSFGRLVHEVSETTRFGDQTECEIAEAWFESKGEIVTQVAKGDQLTLAVKFRAHARIEDPIVGVTLRNDIGHTIFASTTDYLDVSLGVVEAGEELTVRFVVQSAWIAASHYKLTPSIARAGSGADALDLREDLASVYIHASRASGGVADMPHVIEVTRG
jgi:ABC-type polysaccharide/polyol phosphate transport system ATPase subunit